MTKYQLSKQSGLPWATVADICSGKTHLERCSAATLMKLSAALDIPPVELMALQAEPKGAIPDNRPYLEADLPKSIQKAIDDYLQGEKQQVLHLDCLWDELYGSINANQWGGVITKEQADYLRRKYLYNNETGGERQ